MDSSLSNFELTESTLKTSTDSESGSDKSEAMEIIGYGDVESTTPSIKSENGNNGNNDNLPKTVTVLTHKETGAVVYLIGTAHFSRESQNDVEKVIRQVQPNIVVLELDRSRTSLLELDEETILAEAKNIDMKKIMTTIKSDGVVNGAMYILLLNMSAHITKVLGMPPGGEFRVAFKEAGEIPHCLVHLGDRPIGITMRRALSSLTWPQTVRLAWHLLTTQDPISVEEIEKCKDRDILEQLLADLAGEYPAFRHVFLDERDIYLTNSIQTAARAKSHVKPEDPHSEPLKIVAVVGMGHIPGIIRLWPHDQLPYIANILTIPPKSLSSKILKFSFKFSFIAFGAYLIYRFIPVPKSVNERFHKLLEAISHSQLSKYLLN